MKVQLKFLRTCSPFATVYLYLPPANPVDFLFIYNEVTYKVVDAVFTAFDKEQPYNETCAVFIVVEVPTIN